MSDDQPKSDVLQRCLKKFNALPLRTRIIAVAQVLILGTLNLWGNYHNDRFDRWSFGWPYPAVEVSTFFPIPRIDWSWFLIDALILFGLPVVTIWVLEWHRRRRLSIRTEVLAMRRFHLSTIVLLVVTSGGLLGLNLRHVSAGLIGWPIAFDDSKWITVFGLFLDGLIGLSVLGLVAYVSELRIRRKSKPRP